MRGKQGRCVGFRNFPKSTKTDTLRTEPGDLQRSLCEGRGVERSEEENLGNVRKIELISYKRW